MTPAEVFEELVKALIEFFPEERDVRRLAKLAELDSGEIEFRGRARPTWEDTLGVAIGSGKMDALLALAVSQLTQNQKLQAAVAAWQALSANDKAMFAVRANERKQVVHPRLVIPTPVLDLIGRGEAVAKLVASMSAPGTTANITGMGGIGKTQLALAVAEQLAQRYPDQLMIELQPNATPLSADAILGQVIHAFRPKLKLPEALQDLQVQYRSAPAARTGLLLLDNAADSQQVRPLLPPPEGWVAIVTSENQFLPEGGVLHETELLAPEDATALLTRIISFGGRKELEGDDLAPLATLCGGLPLALRLAGTYLVTSHRPLDTYLGALDRARLKYLKDPDGQLTVQAVLHTSVERLVKEAGELAQRWKDLAVFPAPFDVAAAAVVWGVDEYDAQDGLDDLCRRSLVNCAAGRYSLHDLLREIALEEPPADDLRYRHAQHYLERGSAADDLYRQGQAEAGVGAFDEALPHLLAAYAWMRRQTTTESRQWLNEFPDRAIHLLVLRVRSVQMIELLQCGLESARDLKDQAREEHHLSHLGSAYSDIGRIAEAIDCFEKALIISRETKDQRREADALNDLGTAYRRWGDIPKSIGYLQDALAKHREIQAPEATVSDLIELGNAYVYLKQTQRALEYYEQALASSQEAKDQRVKASALAALAGKLEDLPKAIEYYEQALTISEGLGDQYAMATILGQLGSAYLRGGDGQKADLYYARALTLSRDTGDRSGEAYWLGALGYASRAQGESEKASEYYKEALAISRSIGDRARESIYSWELGKEYEKAGELRRAAELMQVKVDYKRQIGHPGAEEDAARVAGIRQRAAEVQTGAERTT